MNEVATKEDVHLMRVDINNLTEMISRAFTHVEERFNKVDERFDGMDQRFDSLENIVRGHSNRIDIAEDRIVQLAHKTKLVFQK